MLKKDYFKCKKCGEIKHKKAYPKEKKSKSGYSGHCKACHAAYHKTYWEIHGKELNERYRKGLTSDCKRFENIKKAHAAHVKSDVQCAKCGGTFPKTSMTNLSKYRKTANKWMCSTCFAEYRPQTRK